MSEEAYLRSYVKFHKESKEYHSYHKWSTMYKNAYQRYNYWHTKLRGFLYEKNNKLFKNNQKFYKSTLF